MKLAKIITVASVIMLGCTIAARAYQINGKYARLISCDFGWSAVRGESGYTGTYEVFGEIWTIYFGSSYCEV